MDSFGAESGFEALSQNTFKIRFFDLFRFQNVYPLNNFKTCYLSVSQKGKGLANMAGGVAVPSQTRLFFL